MKQLLERLSREQLGADVSFANYMQLLRGALSSLKVRGGSRRSAPERAFSPITPYTTADTG